MDTNKCDSGEAKNLRNQNNIENTKTNFKVFHKFSERKMSIIRRIFMKSMYVMVKLTMLCRHLPTPAISESCGNSIYSKKAALVEPIELIFLGEFWAYTSLNRVHNELE
jgi:hypothetical protein